MPYTLMARLHLGALDALARLRDTRGQGTVEYVGLVVFMAAVILAVVAAGGGSAGKDIADTIVDKLSDAVDGIKAPKG